MQENGLETHLEFDAPSIRPPLASEEVGCSSPGREGHKMEQALNQFRHYFGSRETRKPDGKRSKFGLLARMADEKAVQRAIRARGRTLSSILLPHPTRESKTGLTTRDILLEDRRTNRIRMSPDSPRGRIRRSFRRRTTCPGGGVTSLDGRFGLRGRCSNVGDGRFEHRCIRLGLSYFMSRRKEGERGEERKGTTDTNQSCSRQIVWLRIEENLPGKNSRDMLGPDGPIERNQRRRSVSFSSLE